MMLLNNLKPFLSWKFSYLIAMSILFCGFILMGNWVVDNKFDKNKKLIFKIEDTVHAIRYNDEVLTMSARMAAFTGEASWEDRYHEHEAYLDKAIKDAISIIPFGSAETDKANQKLIKLESRAFEHVKNKQPEQAVALLMGKDYERYKILYAKGMEEFYNAAIKKINRIGNEHYKMMKMIDIFNAIGILLILCATYIGYRGLRRQNEQQKRMGEYERMASLGRFSSSLAHEVNNALQPVLGISDILVRRLEKNEETKPEADLAKTISGSATQIREIVQNILMHSKGIESHIIDFQAATQDISVRVNKTDIKQIVKNLMINAGHAMNDKGTIKCSTSLKTISPKQAKKFGMAEGEYILLNIADTGCGMDHKTQKSIFDPFFTTKDIDKGSGLGLSISYGIMQALGGYISVDSALGKGTTFSLHFPIHPHNA